MTKTAPPATYDALERYLPYMVNRLSNLGQQAQKRALSDSEVSLVDIRTLSILNIEDGLTINEIAERTFSEQSTTSRAVDAMAAQGLIERRIPKGDLRRREIMMTPLGRKQLEENWPVMEDYFAALREGTTSEELATCQKVIVKMLENLSRLQK
ncbi:MarR family winged helix-turn-helix transcriptional regulator [Aurantiacibacter rhizosphaerae]|uniref:MarR family transcriptional regulator n=1 Tax=Aurantiacibacter rhizosphaerae TaxID=2691582 RepID=A0A844XAY1_9SPHN|nr:MarR family winged helix-turn-helix transcriptional regulator [Aurantiacibacter rhizosphaerae]MWV26872.1 MarR family transcriptional regulator [Aurantiacibacter rhizosphaerae]